MPISPAKGAGLPPDHDRKTWYSNRFLLWLLISPDMISWYFQKGLSFGSNKQLLPKPR
jgi:hypothetical protein